MGDRREKEGKKAEGALTLVGAMRTCPPDLGGDPARWSVATIPHERDGEDRELRPLEAK